MIADNLRSIAARLCLREDTIGEGRQLLAEAERIAVLESERAELGEQAAELVMALNDPITGLQNLTLTLQRLQAKESLPVDGGAK